jgi:hypothetical protein
MGYWLKAFGLIQAPVDDDWKAHKNGLLTRTATFPRRSGVRPGDRLLYYAVGQRVVFGVYEATSLPFNAEPDDPWGWHVKVAPIVDVDFVHDGVPLEALNVDGRDLRRSIRQHSAIRLTDLEGDAAFTQLTNRASPSSAGAST